ncbi:MAG: xanthine dehydrogenase family protein subunit M [Chloroflexi bacterium]|nr:xanthine dehydrogenase family protein subunit M [Chloroflexota bacterium]
MQDFVYSAPGSLDEALALLNKYGTRARVLAGGTELINDMRRGAVNPQQVIDLKRIPGLGAIERNASGLKVGATARIRDIERSLIVRKEFRILSEAAAMLGSVQVRNKATIGGNICRASPSADMPPCLIAMGATARVVGKSGERTIALDEFFLGPGKTALGADEILTEIQIHCLPEHAACVYLKLSPRKAMDLAVVGVAVRLVTNAAVSRCLDARIGLGAVGPTPIRAKKAEAALLKANLTGSVVEEAARTASSEARPITDVRGSEWYRREMVEVLVRRAINLSLEQIKVPRG